MPYHGSCVYTIHMWATQNFEPHLNLDGTGRAGARPPCRNGGRRRRPVSWTCTKTRWGGRSRDACWRRHLLAGRFRRALRSPWRRVWAPGQGKGWNRRSRRSRWRCLDSGFWFTHCYKLYMLRIGAQSVQHDWLLNIYVRMYVSINIEFPKKEKSPKQQRLWANN